MVDLDSILISDSPLSLEAELSLLRRSSSGIGLFLSLLEPPECSGRGASDFVSKCLSGEGKILCLLGLASPRLSIVDLMSSSGGLHTS